MVSRSDQLLLKLQEVKLGSLGVDPLGRTRSAPIRNNTPRKSSSSTPELNHQVVKAIIDGDTSLVKKLLQQGADPDFKSDAGPLIVLIAVHHKTATALELTKIVYSFGAEANSRDDKDRTALYWAGISGDIKLSQFLLQHGANPNIISKDIAAQTLLGSVCSSGYDTIVQMLLNHKADVNIQSRTGVTPLIAAVWGQHEGVIRLLLDRGADPFIKDTTGKDAVDYAKEFLSAHPMTPAYKKAKVIVDLLTT